MSHAHPVFNFDVDFGGGVRLVFSEVTGLNTEVEVVEHREGDGNDYEIRKPSGMHRAGSVTLKRGVTIGDEASKWVGQARRGAVERRDVTIELMNESHERVAVWKLLDVWPSKLTGPVSNASAKEVAIESIELNHEGIELISG